MTFPSSELEHSNFESILAQADLAKSHNYGCLVDDHGIALRNTATGERYYINPYWREQGETLERILEQPFGKRESGTDPHVFTDAGTGTITLSGTGE